MQFNLSTEILAENMMKSIKLSNQFHIFKIPLGINRPDPDKHSKLDLLHKFPELNKLKYFLVNNDELILQKLN